MMPEMEIIENLKRERVDAVLSVPCDRVKNLLALIPKHFFHIPLTREEEGVGICAGLSLTNKKPLMIVQSSGIGNMVNALCSLTKVYELPLPILVSWRGVYQENIVAQIPMGGCIPDLLKSIGVQFKRIESRVDIPKLASSVRLAFEKNQISVSLMSPKLWEGSSIGDMLSTEQFVSSRRKRFNLTYRGKASNPKMTRYQIIQHVVPYLSGKNVVVNIGSPCKELYALMDQASNFYMLGSLGMASAIGLGLTLGSKKEIVVIDGDGSMLMNPNILCTVAQYQPKNLTILCIDNGVHGSTGNQPTASLRLDLELLAKSFGIKETAAAWDKKTLDMVLIRKRRPQFVHVLAKPGNEPVPDIPLTPLEIKNRFINSL